MSLSARVEAARIRSELRYRRGMFASLTECQQAAITDESTLRAWQCDRRAGKTTAAMVEFGIDGEQHPHSEYAYVALTRNSAERIVWRILKELKRDFRLAWDMGVQKLRVVQPNGSGLTLYGADNPSWLDKLYGQYFRRVWIDEAAFYKIDRRQVREGSMHGGMRYLVYDVLEPSVADQRGSITLMSRPGNVDRGLFRDVCHGVEPGWSLHKWSWRDNKHVSRQVEELLARKRAANPDVVHDPSYRRNWCNEWVSTLGGDQVYHGFNARRCGINKWIVQQGDNVILGLDLGYLDATAFSICTWSDRSPDFIEMESHSQKEMLLDAVAARCRMYMEDYPGLIIVGDPGRKQAFEELRVRYGLPIIAAEKTEKRDWIELVNSDMSEGRYKIVRPEESHHVDEILELVWDRTPAGKLRERHGQANDCCDASLYAYRYANHYRYEEPPSKAPEIGSRAHYDNLERELEAATDAEQADEEEWC